MNSVAQLFSSNDVLLDLDVSDKQALFEAVGRLWEEHYGLAAGEVVDSLNAREKLGSTGLGQGVAIPHARIKGLAKAVAAFVRPKLPIQFDSPDDDPVGCFFVLLVPAQATEQHLQILANVAQMLSNAQFRDRLGESKSQDEIHQLFAVWRLT
jgi:PTS system nitrogen regulatory IIA component